MDRLNPHETANRGYWDAQSGEWIRRFHEHGVAIERLLELRVGVGADAQSSHRDEPDRAWARRWPMEPVGRLRRVS